MATCHSLRVVDCELLGDPLDVKMFQFTGWSYDEGGDYASEQSHFKYDTITPAIARPPTSTASTNGYQQGNLNVSNPAEISLQCYFSLADAKYNFLNRQR